VGFQDAHNCILDFDKDVSLFAVYDGHGGAEVAQYASENLPALVKNDLYKDGEYKEALIKAYLEFDDSLITAPVVEKLTALRKANNGTDSGNYKHLLVFSLDTIFMPNFVL
jgi:protein phosphatase 1G